MNNSSMNSILKGQNQIFSFCLLEITCDSSLEYANIMSHSYANYLPD